MPCAASDDDRLAYQFRIEYLFHSHEKGVKIYVYDGAVCHACGLPRLY
jgi:hypothetical protein